MSKNMNILLVEDNDLDVEFLQRGLKKIGAAGDLLRARDGLEALDILKTHSQSQQIPQPFVILLDINMPRMNGHEFLSALRRSEDNSNTRVFIFTTSDNQKDIEQAYNHHACGYIVKPNATKDMDAILRALKHFWDTCEHPFSGQFSPVRPEAEMPQSLGRGTGS